MINNRFYCFIVFLLLFSSTSIAQTDKKSYLFNAITTEDGLSNNIVYDILQDRDGYVWIATDNGLNRYNGYTSKTFFHNAQDSSSISSSVIRSLVEDSEGNIWVGTRNGVDLFNKETQKFKHFLGSQNSPLLNQEIMKMTLDTEGNIWVNTLNDIGVFNPKTLHFQSVYCFGKDPYMVVANKKVWIQNEKGVLNYYDINLNKLVYVLKDSSLIRKPIYYGHYSKQLWVSSKFQSKKNIDNYRVIPNLPNNLISNSLLEIDANTLWIGSNEGLFEYNYKIKKIKKINLEQSTLVQQIRSIYKDNFDGIWVGTLGGVFHYDPHRNIFHHIELEKKVKGVVMGLYANKDGIYANSLGKGIYYKPLLSNTFKKLKIPKSFPSQGLFIWDIEEVSENNFPIWMATNNGLICYDPKTSKIKKIVAPPIVKNENISFSILNTDYNYLWFSTYKAIHKINKKTGKILSSFSLTNFMKHSGIQKIIMLGDYIFIATEGEGLLVFHTKTYKISKVNLSSKNTENQPFKTPIWDLYVDNETLWIGTNQGLYNLTLNNMLIKPVLLDNQIVFSITQDNQGALWMGLDKGLKVYNPSNQKVDYYNTNNGIKNKEFNRKSVVKTSNGYLWFGGVNGITSFDPVKIKKENPHEPFVHITELKVITSDSSFVVPNNNKEVVLPWEYNSIEITYVGLNYTNASQNKYKYKMEGYDPNWVNSNTPNRARYIKLPVGTHIFNVIAANNDGLWNTKGDGIKIKVVPPIWRTKTAYVLYFLIVLGLINLVHRLTKYRKRIKKVEEEKKEIAKKVEEVAIILNNKSKVYLDQLKYVKSDGNYLEFVSIDKTIIDRNKLKDVLKILPPNFVRVHRSYVINKNFISSQNSTSIQVKPNIEIPISRTFKSNLT